MGGAERVRENPDSSVSNTCEPPKKPPLDPNPPNAPTPPRRDPLVLDLDGNGIQTVGMDAGVRFDHDANGFYERTGWVGGGDGLLVWDRNGNGLIDSGRELFGDQTLLNNGSLAANGFQALAEFDENQDGKIDAQDSIWSQLGVWVDEGYEGIGPDGDSASFFGGTEIHSLGDVGITTINLESTIANTPDGQGNTKTRTGSFVRSDGSASEIAEYVLARDTTDTLADSIALPADIAALPDAEGYGNVYGLQQAMARDNTGALKTLVQSFVTETNATNRAALFEQILFRWTGADKVSATSRGPYMDGRKVAVLEAFYGRRFNNPDYSLAVQWQGIYRDLSEGYYAVMMSQSHLKALYDTLDFDVDPVTQRPTVDDFTAAIALLQAQLTNNPDEGKSQLSEFARTLRGFGLQQSNNYLAFRETFLSNDPSLGWVIDSGGLPVLTRPGQGDFPSSSHVLGTNAAQAILRDPAFGDPYINAYSGQDVVYGSDRDEYLIQEFGNGLLVGGGGDDQLYGGAGDDLLDGGAGHDQLFGEAGDEVQCGKPSRSIRRLPRRVADSPPHSPPLDNSIRPTKDDHALKRNNGWNPKPKTPHPDRGEAFAHAA